VRKTHRPSNVRRRDEVVSSNTQTSSYIRLTVAQLSECRVGSRLGVTVLPWDETGQSGLSASDPGAPIGKEKLKLSELSNYF